MERLRRKTVGKGRRGTGGMTGGNGEKAGGDEEETGRKGLGER